VSALTLDSKYVDILSSLGDLKVNLEEAVRRYGVEQIGERIARLQREISGFQTQYSMPYEIFYARVTTDEEFVRGLRRNHPTWERDFQTWGYYVEEMSEWLGRLESISRP